MIATRLHVKRHSTSALHRPSVANIRYSSYRQRRQQRGRLPSVALPNINNVIQEDDDDDDEVNEETKVEKKAFLFKLFSITRVCLLTRKINK
jgi:hypothetical protein